MKQTTILYNREIDVCDPEVGYTIPIHQRVHLNTGRVEFKMGLTREGGFNNIRYSNYGTAVITEVLPTNQVDVLKLRVKMVIPAHGRIPSKQQ